MQQTANLTLATLHCVREKDSSSSPYLWPALVLINESTVTVGVLAPLVTDDRIVIQDKLHAGQDASIPSSVGSLSFQFDDAVRTDLIPVVALWQKHDTPGNAVDAGFQAFASTLQNAITANLLSLASPDPQTQQTAIDDIKSAVKTNVTSAITNSLSDPQKLEVQLGLLTPDSVVDTSSQVFRSVTPASFTITLGGSLGGRLLSYADSGTPGNVSDPVVVGFGGWSNFKFLFAGGNRIYAVDQNGQLLSYGDNGTPGNVFDPVVVGFGGWSDFKFLFAGGNRIYAVNQNGQLLSYGDNGTPGNVSNPVVVGFGGWSDFKFLFAGGNGIYAVNQNGQLLSFGDNGTPGNVSNPVVVGFGGWSDFKFLFAGGNRIYAVNQNGQLLSYGDNGTPGNVSNPVVVGFDGWSDFKFLFAGGSRIYAAEKALTPDHHYEIDCTLQVTPVTADPCAAQKNAVSADQAAVQNIKDQITALQQEAEAAIGPQKLFLLKQIRDLKKNLGPAQAVLDRANQALASCLAHNSPS
jgi:Tachylectin